MVGVKVLELKFRVHFRSVFEVTVRELTCWCGLHKPFGALWLHLISTLELAGAKFYYGGSITQPERGVLIGLEDTPDTIGISGGEYIDIVPTASTSTASSAEPQHVPTPTSRPRSPLRRAVPRLRSPSRSPLRRAVPRLRSPSRIHRRRAVPRLRSPSSPPRTRITTSNTASSLMAPQTLGVPAPLAVRRHRSPELAVRRHRSPAPLAVRRHRSRSPA